MKQKKKKIDFKYNLRVYFDLLKKYKWDVFVLLIVVLIVEALFVADKFLFKKIIDDGEFFLAGNLSSTVFIQTLIVIGIVFLGIVLFRSIGKWLSEYFLIKFEVRLIKDLKKKYLNHLVGLSHKFHTTHKSGSLISRMSRGASAIENLTDTFIFQFTPLVLQLILVSISLSLFTISSMIVLILTTITFVSYSFYIQRKQEASKLDYLSKEDHEKGFISDIFTNIDSIKYFGKESRIKKIFDKVSDKTKIAQRKNYNYYRWFASGQFLILGIGTFFLIYFPIKELLAGQITLGALVFIYSLYGNISGNLFGFVWGIRNFYRATSDMQDLFEYGKLQNEIKDKPHAKNLEIKKGEIEFKNVSFKYEKGNLFNNFNLKIKPNEKIALVGHSGCGKTTIVKLFNRFYDVNKGEILVDGKNIQDFKQESLRSETGIVPQECILFDDTIYNNIKFSKPDATKREVMNAIKLAQLDKIVESFPKKENTIVGERGVKLSGGEKQRVSIARAILANKKILVLDEATSALDSETEVKIQKALQNLLRGKTSIIIAHRLSTIMNTDRIIVMKKGKIIEQGSHDVLIRKNGEYKKLWNLQKGGYVSD